MAPTPRNSSKTARKTLEDYLAEHRLRQTPERFAILDKALKMPRHFSAAELCRALADDTFIVSRATVYSTLNILVDSGVLQRVIVDGRTTRYTIVAKNATSNIYLVCTECGKIKTVKDERFNAVMRAKRYSAFTLSHYSLNIYGTCNECARKLHKRKLEH